MTPNTGRPPERGTASAGLQTGYERAARYDSAPDWKLLPGGWPRNRYEAANRLCTGGDSILELGCGDGLLLYNLVARYRRVVGVDMVPSRVDVVRAELSRQKFAERIEVIAHAADSGLPERLNGERFDWVVWSDVIEHVPELRCTFEDIARLVKPGGWLVTVTPNVAYFKRRLTLLAGKFPSTSGGDEGFAVPEGEMFDGGHLHYFTFRAVERFHRQYGFDLELTRLGYGRLGRLHNLRPQLLSPGVAVRSRSGSGAPK